MIESLRTLDHNIFFAINNFAGSNHFIDVIAKFLAGNIFIAIWVLGILAIGYTRKNRLNIYAALVSAAVSRLAIVEILKRVIDRQRPYEALANIHQLFADSEHGVSFPSGHTVIYFSFAFAFLGTKYFWPFFALAVIASLDRVYVGVHYPADILVSAIIGGGIGYISQKLFYKKMTKTL